MKETSQSSDSVMQSLNELKNIENDRSRHAERKRQDFLAQERQRAMEAQRGQQKRRSEDRAVQDGKRLIVGESESHNADWMHIARAPLESGEKNRPLQTARSRRDSPWNSAVPVLLLTVAITVTISLTTTRQRTLASFDKEDGCARRYRPYSPG